LAELFTEREVVGRTGGDEFVVLAQWNIERRSAAISEAIRKQIMALQIPVDDGILAVTASIGYSTVRSEADLNAALTRAVSALYRAKERGRNRVEAALVAA
jgi:diguanylate cyclase (GGDEF)-like protein